MSKQQIDFLTYTQLTAGGNSTPSNWANYPATNNVQMSNYAMLGVNRIESSNDLSLNPFVYYTSNISSNNSPIFQCVQTNGGGSNQPDSFQFWKGTYVKNDPFGSPNEIWSLFARYDTGLGQWCMGAEWEGYITLPLQIAGTPLTFSVGSADSQQLFLSSTNGGSGKLWVDSNGALYWNSNLLANA